MKSKFSIFNSAVVIALLFSTSQLNSQTFFKLTSGTTNNLISVAAPTDQIAYAAGAAGTVLKTNNAGVSWSKQTTVGAASTLYSVYFTSSNVGYVVGDNGTALKTSDGGATAWVPMTISPNTVQLRGIKFCDKLGFGNFGFATGGTKGNGNIYKTTNGGASWSPVISIADGKGPFYSIFFVMPAGKTLISDVIIYVLRGNGDIVKVIKQGASYTTISAGIGQGAAQIYFTSPTKGIVGSNNGSVFSTSNAGTTWTKTPQATTNTLSGCDFYDNTTNGYIVGGNVSSNSGIIIGTTDGGVNWNSTNLPAGTPRLCGIDFYSSCLGYTVGLNGTIFKFTNKLKTYISTTSLDTICIGQPTILNAIGGSSFTWSPPDFLNKTNVATVISTPSSIVTYKLMSSDGIGCQGSAMITLNVVDCKKSLTGLEESIEENGSLAGKIFPNPTSGIVNIYPIAGNELTSISVMDALGRTVYETKAIDNASAVEINLSNQPEGVYFVLLLNGSNLLNKKIIKQ